MLLAASHASRLSQSRCSATRRREVPRLRQDRIRPGDAHGVCVPSQFCSCTAGFRAFPLFFPHMPSVNFHLDVLFFSRDRPTDSLFRGSGEKRLASAALIHPLRTQTRPIAEVHLGFWVFIRHAVRSSAFISLAARSCLGIGLFQVCRTPQSACPRVLENTLEPLASARPLPAGFPLLGFVAIISDVHRPSLVAACIRCIADPSASSRGRRLIHPVSFESIRDEFPV